MLWPKANVKDLTHLSAVAREFPPQRVPKGEAQLTLGAQIDGEGEWPKRNNSPLHPPKSWGLTTFWKDARLMGGAQEEVASQT